MVRHKFFRRSSLSHEKSSNSDRSYIGLSSEPVFEQRIRHLRAEQNEDSSAPPPGGKFGDHVPELRAVPQFESNSSNHWCTNLRNGFRKARAAILAWFK